MTTIIETDREAGDDTEPPLGLQPCGQVKAETVTPITGFCVHQDDAPALKVLMAMKDRLISMGMVTDVYDDFIPEGIWVALVSTDMGTGQGRMFSLNGINKRTSADLSVADAHRTVCVNVCNIYPAKVGRPGKGCSDPATKLAGRLIGQIAQMA